MFLVLLAVLIVLGWDRLLSIRLLRRRSSLDEVRFLSSIAGELRAGASLRLALVHAATAEDDPVLSEAARLALAGAPLGDVAALMARLPINGRRAAAALRVAEISGGRSTPVFARLADRAIAELQLIREQRAITTQSRLSALVVVALPVASLVFGGGRRILDLAGSGSVGLFLAGLGVALQLMGVTAVLWLART